MMNFKSNGILNIIIIVGILLFVSSCYFIFSPEVMERQSYDGKELNLNGYYYSEYVRQSHYFEKDSIHNDLVNYKEYSISSYTFYKDGSALFLFDSKTWVKYSLDYNDTVGFAECHRFIQEKLENNEIPGWQVWGLYKVQNDTLTFQYFSRTGGAPFLTSTKNVNEKRFVINLDGSITIVESRNTRTGESEHVFGHKKFMPFDHKVDSSMWDMESTLLYNLVHLSIL